MNRRLALGAAVVAMLAAALTLYFVVTLPGPNRQSAVNAVQQAGLKPGVTPGPTWEKP